MKTYLTKEQAMSVLPEGDAVHTFMNPGFGLVGADWSREDIIEKIQRSDVLALTSEMARSMGHGMCVYNSDAKYQSDILFIETDEEKLKALEVTLTEVTGDASTGSM